MKILNIILIKLSILFTASCCCEGYGYETGMGYFRDVYVAINLGLAINLN
jgi:hypothetical protein